MNEFHFLVNIFTLVYSIISLFRSIKDYREERQVITDNITNRKLKRLTSNVLFLNILLISVTVSLLLEKLE